MLSEIKKVNSPILITERLINIANTYPDSNFIYYKNYSISYKQFYTNCDLLKKWIINNNYNSKIVPIVLIADKSPLLVTSVLGILLSGTAYNIIDKNYPSKRIESYINILQPKLILNLCDYDFSTFNELNDLLNIKNISYDYELNKLDGISNNISNDISNNISNNIEIDEYDICSYAFTSGTEGTPKVVQGIYGSLTYFYDWMGSKFNIETGKERFSLLSGISHDPFQRDVFTTIWFGGSLFIPDTNDYIYEWFSNSKITIAHMTPGMAYILCAQDEYDFPNLKHIFFLGDKITKDVIYKIKEKAPNAKITNLYGSTESQRAVSYYEIDFTTLDTIDIIPIGKGMYDTNLYILDENLKEVNENETGIIYIRSHFMSRGYMNIASDKWIINPFNNKDTKDILYRTGDIGYKDESGNIICLGRKDNQVKLNGYRINLNNIDYFLQKHTIISNSITIKNTDKLISYVIVNDINENTLDTRNIIKYLREYLPEYEIPSYIIKLSEFPLNINNKIDRSKLPSPNISNNNLDHIEQFIYDIIGIPMKLDNTISEYGLDSIKISLLCHQLNKKYNIKLCIPDFYNYNTLNEILNKIELVNRNYLNNYKEIFDSNIIPSNFANNRNILNILNWATIFKTPKRNILILGGCGYIGTYLTQKLKDIDNTKLYVMINKTQPEIIYNNVEYIRGNITKPNLGILENYTDLNKNINIVINCVADVNWLKSFNELYNINAVGIINVLKFCDYNTKQLIHLSTTGIFNNNKKIISNNLDEFPPNNGYSESKWFCEKLLSEAMGKTRIPISIIRFGYILGDGKTYANNSNDFIVQYINFCNENKIVPNIHKDNIVNIITINKLFDVIRNICYNNLTQSYINLYNGIKVENLVNDFNYINYDTFIDKVNENYPVLSVLSHLLKKSISSPTLDLEILK
jgi:L-2-aminoadipate reductase